MPARNVALLLGDSITQFGFSLQPSNPNTRPHSGGCGGIGWGALLLEHLSMCRSCDVLSRGLAGYNTRWYLQHVDTLLQGVACENVCLVTIMFGANDAARAGEKQHVPLPEFEENLQRLTQLVLERCKFSKVLLLTPPPVAEEKWWAYCAREFDPEGLLPSGFEAGGGRDLATIATYADAARRVAAGGPSDRVALADVQKAIREVKGWDAAEEPQAGCLSDGLHLNARGNQAVFEAVLAATDAWPGLLDAAAASDGIPHFSQMAEGSL